MGWAGGRIGECGTVVEWVGIDTAVGFDSVGIDVVVSIEKRTITSGYRN